MTLPNSRSPANEGKTKDNITASYDNVEKIAANNNEIMATTSESTRDKVRKKTEIETGSSMSSSIAAPLMEKCPDAEIDRNVVGGGQSINFNDNVRGTHEATSNANMGTISNDVQAQWITFEFGGPFLFVTQSICCFLWIRIRCTVSRKGLLSREILVSSKPEFICSPL